MQPEGGMDFLANLIKHAGALDAADVKKRNCYLE